MDHARRFTALFGALALLGMPVLLNQAWAEEGEGGETPAPAEEVKPDEAAPTAEGEAPAAEAHPAAEGEASAVEAQPAVEGEAPAAEAQPAAEAMPAEEVPAETPPVPAPPPPNLHPLKGQANVDILKYGTVPGASR